MATSKSYKEVKEKLLKDPEFRREYEALKIASMSYTTDDTDLASYLCSLGAKTPVLDRTNPRIAYIFELTEQQMDAIPHFKDGTGMVSGMAISNSRKMLLRMIKTGVQG